MRHRNPYWRLETTIGDVDPSMAAVRSAVCVKRLPVPGREMNCLGRDFRLDGQSLVPEPPDRITGRIFMWCYGLNIL